MCNHRLLSALAATLLVLSTPGSASPDKRFKLTSSEVSPSRMIDKQQEYNGDGCNGENISPSLSWSGAPAGTQSFALTLYDPNAPTGSGYWHWLIINIPASTASLKANAGNIKLKLAPPAAQQMKNDFGFYGYGGPCPPVGSVHLYQFVLHALDVKSLDLPKDTSGASTGFKINAHTIGTASLTAAFAR